MRPLVDVNGGTRVELLAVSTFDLVQGIIDIMLVGPAQLHAGAPPYRWRAFDFLPMSSS